MPSKQYANPKKKHVNKEQAQKLDVGFKLMLAVYRLSLLARSTPGPCFISFCICVRPVIRVQQGQPPTTPA
jgi:hypothetical protein